MQKRHSVFTAALAVFTAAALLSGCNPTPELTGISPDSGPETGGQTVTISGEKFREGLTVNFGGKNVTPTSVTKTAVTLTTPAGNVGSVQVEVTNPKEKKAETVLTYAYKDTTAPTLTTLTPADGHAYAQGTDYEDAINTGIRQISAVFSEPISTGSVAVSFDSHENAIMSGHTGTVEGDTVVQDNQITFTAAGDLLSSRKYMVTVKAADAAGNESAETSAAFAIEPPERVHRYVVQEGDTLQSIAARPDTYDDMEQWKKIAIVNADYHELNAQKPQPGLRLYLHWNE